MIWLWCLHLSVCASIKANVRPITWETGLMCNRGLLCCASGAEWTSSWGIWGLSGDRCSAATLMFTVIVENLWDGGALIFSTSLSVLKCQCFFSSLVCLFSIKIRVFCYSGSKIAVVMWIKFYQQKRQYLMKPASSLGCWEVSCLWLGRLGIDP